MSESAIVNGSLDDRFEGDRAGKQRAVLIRRLNKLTQQYGEIDRKNAILIETLGTFIQYFLTVTPPVPANQVDAAQAKGQQRYGFFVDQVTEILHSGQGRLLDAVDDALMQTQHALDDAELHDLSEVAEDA